MAVTSILVWAVIGSSSTNGDQIIGQARLYKELYETIANVTAEIQNGTQQVYLLEVGKILNPKDFCSRNGLTPSQNAMERTFKLTDVLPATGSSTITNLKDCRSVSQAYTESLDKVASLVKEEARALMDILQKKIPTPATPQWLHLYRYLQYEEEYEGCNASTCGHTDVFYRAEGRQEPCGSKCWYMEETLCGELEEWEQRVGRAFVKSWLKKTSTMMELEKKVQSTKALLRVQQMGIQEDSAEPFYSITLSPADWCKHLDKRVNETEVQALHYLEEQKRLIENEVLETEKSFHLYGEEIASSESRLKDIKAQLQELVQEQALLSVECKINHKEKGCSNYKEVVKKVSVLQRQYAAEKAMSSIYGDKIRRPSESRIHQDEKVRAMTEEIQKIKSQAKRTPFAMTAEAHSRQGSPKQNSDSKLSENGMRFRFTPEVQDYHQLWRLTPEPGGPKEVPAIVREIATYLGTEATKPQVSAKLVRIDIHRDWLDLSPFNTNYVFQKTNGILISSGRMPPLDGAPHPHPEDLFLLPLFPSAFLLATDIQLVFTNISDPASLFQLAYEPHASGSYGPFSFGPMHKGGDSRRLKFRVDRSRERTVVSLPRAQLIGYICSVVPKFPKTKQ